MSENEAYPYTLKYCTHITYIFHKICHYNLYTFTNKTNKQCYTAFQTAYVLQTDTFYISTARKHLYICFSLIIHVELDIRHLICMIPCCCCHLFIFFEA